MGCKQERKVYQHTDQYRDFLYSNADHTSPIMPRILHAPKMLDDPDGGIDGDGLSWLAVQCGAAIGVFNIASGSFGAKQMYLGPQGGRMSVWRFCQRCKAGPMGWWFNTAEVVAYQWGEE